MTELGTPPSYLSESVLTSTSNTYICHVEFLKYIYIQAGAELCQAHIDVFLFFISPRKLYTQ